jgi:hypothetical protein
VKEFFTDFVMVIIALFGGMIAGSALEDKYISTQCEHAAPIHILSQWYACHKEQEQPK